MRMLVIPSNREGCLRSFFNAWEGKGGWDEVIVIEDGPSRTFALPTKRPYRHFSHAEIADVLGDDSWIISRRDSACRCFGFLAAWWAGAEAVLTLDDDTRPHAGYEDLFALHLKAISSHPRWHTSCPGLRVRGLPYQNVGVLPNVVANVGLWSGVPDLDARTQLASPLTDFTPPLGSEVIPAGQYVPVSGMNLCLQRRALPLFYFPLMGADSPYARFDDIWAGVIAKKCMDHLGWHLAVGEPFVRHERASDPKVNLTKEAPGLAAHEDFWRVIDVFGLLGRGPLKCIYEISAWLRLTGLNLAIAPGYLHRLGKALQVWGRLFTEKPKGL